jgi:cell division inhibitor SepF
VNTILTKLKDFVGISEQDEYDEYEEWEQDPNNEPEERRRVVEEELPPLRRSREPLNLNTDTAMGPSTRSNVIGMPGINNSAAEVVVIEPHSFEEMPQVIQTLRERKSVVLNLNAMNATEAQRAVDFVAGGTYAIDGHQERIGESIFLFTPNCVKVSTLTGIVHDVPEVPKATPRMTTPSPTWAAEVNRMAQ